MNWEKLQQHAKDNPIHSKVVTVRLPERSDPCLIMGNCPSGIFPLRDFGKTPTQRFSYYNQNNET